MKVTFTKTGERRYRVSVEGPDIVPSWMEPAPGYDSLLPHDMAHFVVENELGIRGGVFGQLATGGDSGTFHTTDNRLRRKLAKRGHRLAVTNRDDALLSERLVDLARRMWANDKTGNSTPVKGVSVEDLNRVCRQFESVSAIWSKLEVGEGMTLDWTVGAARNRLRRHR